jgi:hypothetical protein
LAKLIGTQDNDFSILINYFSREIAEISFNYGKIVDNPVEKRFYAA